MASFSGHKIITDLRRGFFPLVKLMKNLNTEELEFFIQTSM
jgi:hypothetical protein